MLLLLMISSQLVSKTYLSVFGNLWGYLGGSATAAGQLIKQAGGNTLEYLFIVALPFLKGLDKLDAPAYYIVEAED